MSILFKDRKRLLRETVLVTLCAGFVEDSVAWAAPFIPPGPPVHPIADAMAKGSPTAGSIRSSMARKAVRPKGPQILKFEIHALGRLEDIVIHNKTNIHEGAVLRQLAFLKQGKPISAKDVQRAAGLVTDLSGVEAVVVSEPGSAPGTAVLHVTVLPDKSPRGDFSLDNYGNRYLGYGEGMFNYDIRNLTHEGDSLFTHIETTGHKYTNGTVM